MCTEITADNSYFNQDTKQNNAKCQNAENPHEVHHAVQSECTSSQGNSGWSSKRCSWFCSGKNVWQHCSSHKIRWGPIQHIFSWTLIKATDNSVFFFAFWRATVLCLVSRLKKEISIWIFVYVSKNVCLLKICICILIDLLQLKCFTV